MSIKKPSTNASTAFKTIGFLCLLLIAGNLILLCTWYDLIVEQRYNFYISFFASSLENLIFFILIGLSIAIYSLRRPESELLENRIWYLYSSEHATDESLQYNKNQIKKLAAFCKSATGKITITDYNPSMNAYRIEVEKRYTLQNMFKDRDYEDVIDISISPDSIESDQLEMNLGGVPSKIMGEVHLFQTTVIGEAPVKHNEKVIKITDQDYKTKIGIRIPANGTTEYEFNYWMWCLVGEPNVTQVLRYTETLKTTIVNHWDGKAVISLKGQEGPVEFLEHNAQLDLEERKKFTPADNLTFWWRDPNTIAQSSADSSPTKSESSVAN